MWNPTRTMLLFEKKKKEWCHIDPGIDRSHSLKLNDKPAKHYIKGSKLDPQPGGRGYMWCHDLSVHVYYILCMWCILIFSKILLVSEAGKNGFFCLFYFFVCLYVWLFLNKVFAKQITTFPNSDPCNKKQNNKKKSIIFVQKILLRSRACTPQVCPICAHRSYNETSWFQE